MIELMTEGVVVSIEMIISKRSSNIEMIEYSIITDSYFGIKIAINGTNLTTVSDIF